MFYENYACGSDRNYTGFCDKQVDSLIDRQSSEADPEKRRELVWEIERTLARDASRPIIFYTRAATCWHPRVKGPLLQVQGWHHYGRPRKIRCERYESRMRRSLKKSAPTMRSASSRSSGATSKVGFGSVSSPMTSW